MEKLGEESENWRLFSEGVLQINSSGKYEHKEHLAFKGFVSIVLGGHCDLRGKTSYYEGLCHRFWCFGAENDMNEAIRFMDIGVQAGVFYYLVDLAASYKRDIMVDANQAKYDEFV